MLSFANLYHIAPWAHYASWLTDTAMCRDFDKNSQAASLRSPPLSTLRGKGGYLQRQSVKPQF